MCCYCRNLFSISRAPFGFIATYLWSPITPAHSECIFSLIDVKNARKIAHYWAKHCARLLTCGQWRH